MSCADVERFLGAYADGEVNPERRGDLEAHLRGCPGCSARLRDLEEQNAALAALRGGEPQPPAALKRNLRRRLRRNVLLALARVSILAVAVALVAVFVPIAIAKDLPPLARALFGLSGLALCAALAPLLWRALWDVKNVVWVRLAVKEEDEQ
jgi:anti-sigma factor RsiW